MTDKANTEFTFTNYVDAGKITVASATMTGLYFGRANSNTWKATFTNCYAAGTAMHSWQATAQGKSTIAHKGMLAAAKVMACVGAELLMNPEKVAQAQADWKEELNGEVYPNPLPADAKPEIW